MRPSLPLSSADFPGRFLARAVALSAILSGAAACDGQLAGSPSAVDVLDATTPLASSDASASPSPPTGDAAVVDLLADSGPPPEDSAPAADSSLPPWGYGLDASPPASFDATCGMPDGYLFADAAPGTCELSPADIACTTASDCTVLMVGHCCYSNAYGMNRSSPAVCPMPPCALIPPPGGCGPGGFITDDCSNAPSLSDVGVACIDHQCRTFATVGP